VHSAGNVYPVYTHSVGPCLARGTHLTYIYTYTSRVRSIGRQVLPQQLRVRCGRLWEMLHLAFVSHEAALRVGRADGVVPPAQISERGHVEGQVLALALVVADAREVGVNVEEVLPVGLVALDVDDDR